MSTDTEITAKKHWVTNMEDFGTFNAPETLDWDANTTDDSEEMYAEENAGA